MIAAKRAFLLLAGLPFLIPPDASAADPIPAKDFQRLHALIKPQNGEDRWAQIPWLTSLWEARQRAAVEGKPILLWEMDGHPLGCV
jgi:hypothetical protein